MAKTNTSNLISNHITNKSLNPVVRDIIDSSVNHETDTGNLLAKNYTNAVTLTGDTTLGATHYAHPVVVTADATLTLPATAAGLHLHIICGADGKLLTESPNARDKFVIDVAGAAGTDNKDAILAAATSKAGDYIKLQADGSAGWNILELGGTWVDQA